MNRWDKKYKELDFGYGEVPNVFLRSQESFLTGLENGFVPADGQGRNGVWMAELGLAVRTIDISQVAVDDALALAEKRGVLIDAWRDDLKTMQWPTDQWDCIVSIWVHMPPELRAQVHTGFWKSLRPGGLIILEAYRPEHIHFRSDFGTVGGPPSAEGMYTEEILRSDFPDGDFEFLEEQDVLLDEGTGHQGRSATIQARIRKPL